jgi:hypothetical protein
MTGYLFSFFPDTKLERKKERISQHDNLINVS